METIILTDDNVFFFKSAQLRLEALISLLEELAPIHHEALELRRLLHDANTTTTWQIISSSPTSVCSYRPDPHSPCHWVKMSGTMQAPLLHIIALINEVDLYHTFIPFLKFAKQLAGKGIRCVRAVISQFRFMLFFALYRKVVHLSLDLPWPISERELLIYGYSADDLEGSHQIHSRMDF